MGSLSGLTTWRNIIQLGYFGLESVLSIMDIVDEFIICADPTSQDDTLKLAHAIANKYPKVRVVEFEWPKESSNGSAIGIAHNYALGHVRTTHGLVIQADESWCNQLATSLKTDWQRLVNIGVECIAFKVLHTEFNCSGFQGGGDWSKQNGSAYVHAIKFFKKCPAIRFAPDAWSMDGCGPMIGYSPSESYPIIHMHDWFRDTVIERRRSQAEDFWSDIPHYRATYEAMRDGMGQWKGLFEDKKWEQTTSMFDKWLPDNIKRHLGQKIYQVHWEDLQ